MGLGLISADFLFNLEKTYRFLNERNYMSLLADDDTWYPRVLKTKPFASKSERFLWMLETASIEQLSAANGGEDGGSLNFDELQTIMQEYFPAYFGRGYKIGKLKYRNFLSGGVDPVARWTGSVGTYGAYLPQRLTAIAILNGGNVNGYDGVPFFSKVHPVHPLIPALGTYANDFTGAPVAASGLTPAYPGALPIDDSVSLDTAMTNLSKALAYIAGAISQPNGAGDPRNLRPAFLMGPPRMQVRLHQLLNADTIAQLAGSSGNAAGGADIRGIWKKFRLAEPIIAKELDGSRSYSLSAMVNPTGAAATLQGNDTSYYIAVREAEETELGSFLQNLREPFTLHTYTGETGSEGVDAVLGRSQDMEWHYDAWTAVNYGHPYTFFRFQGS